MITQQSIEVPHHKQTIRGQLYLPGGASISNRCPAVLFLHGFTGQRMEPGFMFVYLARQLAENGIAALTFDFLNSGESDGHFSQMLVTNELADAMHMADYLAHIPVVDRSRLGLLGFSLGGLLSACVVARTNIFKTLTMLAPTTVENICRHAADRAEKTPDHEPVAIGSLTLHPDFFDNVQTLNPLADCIENPRPTLLIQGTGDEAVTPDVSQHFVNAINSAGIALTHHLIPDADHTFTSPAWRDDLNSTITQWVLKNLVK